MSTLTLRFDDKADETIQSLQSHYNIDSKADLIRKALALLKLAACIEYHNGELCARKKDNEGNEIIKQIFVS